MKFYLTPWSGQRTSGVQRRTMLVFCFVLIVVEAVSASITWRVLEESKPGTLVGNLRQYTTSFANYDLSTSSKNFVYHKITGNVTTRHAIDRDVLSKLCVNGSELETIQFTSTKNGDSKINVQVFIDDINDNWPQFASDIFTKVISEEVDKDFTITIPTAQDKDCGVNSTLQYKILNTAGSQYFALKVSPNKKFLDIVLVKKLDREIKAFHILNIQACDNGIPSKCNSTIVNITVTDFNDNKPLFHNLKSEVHVQENCDNGSHFILELNVTDKDSGENGQFTLSVSSAFEYKGLFVVDTNRYLVSTKCLKHDKNKPYIDIVINAVDHGIPVQHNDVTIRIVIVDINDHDPVLSTLLLTPVYENEHVVPYVGIITATDNDDGPNANVTLKIVNGNPKKQFYVVKIPDVRDLFYLKLNGTLDREEIDEFNITIQGSDHGMPPRTAFINVIIPVLDQNDNHPNCSFPQESIFLSESSPVGSFVTVVNAVDKDDGKNSEINYKLADKNDLTLFNIIESSGLITTAGLLDYEIQTLITLKVLVEDNGDPVLSSFCSLTINIMDVNDNKPLFASTTLKFEIFEDADVNSVVANLTAFDADAGKNSEITFSIMFPSPLVEETFYLNRNTGAIQTATALDRETCEFYHLLVLVQDNGNPTLSSTATVDLTILDVNDNYPVFYPTKYFVNIFSNQSGGFIANVTAVDCDKNDIILYEIVSKDPPNALFNVNQSTGTFMYTALSQLDPSDVYTVELVAKDSQGHVSNISTVYITVITPKDDLPQFEMDMYSFNTEENVERGTYIGRVKAESKESLVDLFYHIYSGDPDGIFFINGNGEIRNSGDLDYEKQSLFNLQVMAKTLGKRILIGWTSVNIFIEDVNDNQPEFQYPLQLITIKSTAPVGSFVYKARALDPDLGNGGIVKYEMLHGIEQGFSIHESGNVFVANDLSQKSNYSPVISIIASDSGLPQLSSVLNLTVSIIKENRQPPFIHTNFGVIPILRNMPLNQPFFNITASDPDGGEIYFHLFNTDNVSDFFGIFPEGNLYVRQPLLLTSQFNFPLQIIAVDRGHPRLNSTAFVNISVSNIHQHQQLFRKNTFEFDIYENEDVGTVIGKLEFVTKFQNLKVDFVEKYADFSFDRATNEIKIKQIIDREQLKLITGRNSYLLYSKASYKNGFGLQTIDLAKIVVEVKDRNDNVPLFSQPNYVVHIEESEKVGNVIYKVITYDNDQGKNAKVNYSILTSSLPDAVIVNEDGKIFLHRSQENKNIFYFNFSLQVMNIVPPYFNSTCLVEVNIHDVNNNKPQFKESSIMMNISENFAIGQTIYDDKASDNDSGRNSLLTYRIISGNKEKNFEIDRESGEVMLIRELDFENVQSYVLTISATDSGIWPLSTKQILIVNVTDVNDNSPRFTNCPAVVELKEDAPVDCAVIQCQAVDSDTGNNAIVIYSIAREKPSGNYLRIDNNGTLFINKPLDREQFSVYMIDVKAEDSALPETFRLMSTKTIAIHLTDVNDNAPRFTSPPAVYFDNSASQGYHVTTLTARDPDLGLNGTFTFSKGSDKDAFLFRVDSNGRITFAINPWGKVLYKLDVIVTDSGAVRRKAVQELSVFMYKGGGLSFLKRVYSASILENEPERTFVIKVTAGAKIKNDGTMVRYFMTNDSSEGLLFLNSTTGVITIGSKIDRESTYGHHISLVIYAVDVNSKTPKSTSVNVYLTILDLNDNIPTFLEYSYKKDIYEDTKIGSNIITLRARDEDEGRNGSIVYEIVSGNNERVFHINNITGQIFVANNLDREVQSLYILNVTASDNGVPSLTSWTIVSINILDVNDNMPTFQKFNYSFTVWENSPIGTVIGRAVANDPDSGRNGQLMYSLTGDDGSLFTVDANRGTLKTAFSFDREKIDFYLFKVVASDKGSPGALSTAALVYVSILDENDNSPKFNLNQRHTATVFENSLIGTPVITVNASDQDVGLNSTLFFTISGRDSNRAFHISDHGTLFTSSVLDRENIAQYNLKITVSDCARNPSQRRSSSTIITVIVGDVNDHAPYFVSGDVIHVREDHDSAKPFTSVLARDKDTGLNGEVLYNLQGFFAKTFFQINQYSGQLSLKQTLDREKLEKGHINITVEAKDRGKPPKRNQQYIQIVVDDVNDNTPEFEPHVELLNVHENISIGSELSRVTAIDEDQDLNGKVEYAIVAGNVNDAFTIHPVDGIITLMKQLDRENFQNYQIDIKAFDFGSPARENHTLVRIHVLDVNDNKPRFTSSPSLKAIKENIPYIQDFARFVAVDDDEGKNSEVMYSILHPGRSPFVYINNTTGVVSLVSPLDREVQTHYSVVIEARDKGTPALYTRIKFSISVQDENDNSPLFVNPTLKPSILEGSSVGSELCVMNATDADSGANADISYTLVNDFGRFKIDSHTGKIFTIAELDRETHGTEFELTVKVQDKGNPSRVTFATVIGRIKDIDDNIAEFESKTYSAYIPMGAPEWTFVTVVSAFDKDEGLNGKVIYKFENSSSDFLLEPDAGHVFTKRRITSSTMYSMKIQAINAKTNKFQDTATLDVTTTTKQFPSFQIPVTVYNISEDAKPGYFILQVKATDNPSFQIASGDLDKQFSLDIISKNITLNKHLDYEEKRHYNLLLKASVNTIYSTYINIQVFVVDSNDNIPVFEQSLYDTFVVENDSMNVSVTCTIAEDRDSGALGLVEYTILEASALKWFRIDKYTGCIYTTRSIDREQYISFDFTIRARDHGLPPNTNNVSVRINVLDANDNPPILNKLSPIYISEDESPTVLVTTVYASDQDESSNLIYSLKQEGNLGNTFNINSTTGEVFLINKLDREIVARYLLTVTVSDGKFSDTTSLIVIVTDVDDNPPTFLESFYMVKYMELQPVGSVVMMLNISDKDIGRNSVVVYSFKRTITSEMFRINSNGIITVATQFQFFKPTRGNGITNLYNLTVYAQNPNHPLTKPTATIIVEVTDANDHYPIFERIELYGYIPTVSKRGTLVTTVHAVDDYDVGLNKDVLYSAVDGNGTSLFTVESTTGRVTVNGDISSENNKLFLLEIQAIDLGKPAQFSPKNATVFIVVTIKNQHPPKFTKKRYSKELKENYDVGKEFLRVLATDGDSGINGIVRYRILPGKQGRYFNIDRQTGSLAIANVKLDYEYLKEYSFDIEAEDGAPQPQTDQATVTVSVLDYNDNPPEFLESLYDVNLVENNEINSEVIVVTATDRDTVGNIITYLLAGKDKNAFTIDQSSGKISTSMVFDYESRTVFNLTVLAKDSGNPQKTSDCAVVVKVQGINEFTPKFNNKTYLFSIPEDIHVGTIVGQVSATDRDKGPDGIVRFILVDPSGLNNNFDVDQYTGNIYVRGRLDRENRDVFQLTVLAKNPVQTILTADNTDIAIVTIKIQDRNDPPRFLHDLLKVSIDENVSVGSVLGNLTAVDDDTDSDFSSPFKYTISSGNIYKSFRLETVGKSVLVKTNKRLDREVMALFNLTIAATDISDPNLTGFAFLVVEVKDVNDNSPFLKPDICPGHVQENLPSGAVVLRFDAFDKDIDPNKDPYTFLIMNKEPVPFVVDKFTSELKTSEMLDREKVPLYVLQVKILDSGYPKQFSTTSCRVIVDDVNDNRPSGDTLNVKVNVPATGFVGGAISDVSPFDLDEIKKYTCEVEGNHKDIFDFQPNSCILNMKKPHLERYILNVIALDDLYRVSYSLNISFNKISATTIQTSVILRLSGISPEKFLAVMNHLPCISGYEKQIYSVQEVTTNYTDILVAHIQNGVYISRDKLSQILIDCKNSLERKIGAKIVDTNYNLCSTSNPCIYGKCESRIILIPQNRTNLYSQTKIFVSAYHRATFLCICDPGYSGEFCQHSNKVCEGKPCRNSGQCIPTDQGFKCLCLLNFTGKFCDTALDLCHSNSCSKTSQCVSTHEGPKCQCDFGGRGEKCEFSSIGFRPLSYMTFSGLLSTNGKSKNNISLQIATVEKNALTLYTQDSKTDERSHFIALEIIDGWLRFSFNLGNGTVRITSDVYVSDGSWHTVSAVRDNKIGHLYVDTKVSSVNGNDHGIARLELGSSAMYIGGVPSLDLIFENFDHVSSYDFVGCMRDIYLNDVLLDVDMAVSRYKITPSCPRVSECHQSSCHQGSTCIDKWFNTLCQCKDDKYNGRKCNEKIKPLTLSDGSVLRFQFDPSYERHTEFLERQNSDHSRRRRNVENLESFSMQVRVRNDDAILWRAQDDHGNFTQLQTKSGFVYLSLGNGVVEKQQVIISDKYVNNGHWFNISLSRDKSSYTLTLNVNNSQNETRSKEPYVLLSGTWTFGSLRTSDDSVNNFQGCLSGLKINGEIITLNVSNQYGLLTLEEGNFVSGCESPDYCASSPCPGSKCVNNWHSYSCVASLDGNDTLSIGAIAGIVFFCILVVAIIVAVIAVMKRRTRNEFAARISSKNNRSIERDNSGTSSSESLPSRKTISRQSLDSGVDIRNRSSSLSHENLKKTSSSSTNVIALGSPDEYTIVTSQHDSISDDKDKGFTDSESEYGVLSLGANLTISSIPSRANNVHVDQRQPSRHAPLSYKSKVPFLINRGFLKDVHQSSRSASPSDEPESIEMQNYSNEIENAEQYSIGNASFATYSDLNDPSYNPSRYSGDRMRYKPSLERFSESDDSDDGRQLSNLPNSFEPTAQFDSPGESSDGDFTSSECDFEQRSSFEDDEETGVRESPLRPEILRRGGTESYCNVSDYEGEMNVDEPVEMDSINLDDIVRRKTNKNAYRDTYQAIAQFGEDGEDVEIV